MAKFDEIGTQGLPEYSGFVNAAYNTELFWPSCYPLYNRLRRSDPEITIVRTGYGSLARKMEMNVETVEQPTDDDKRAVEFYESELENVEGGISRWIDGATSYTPFMGWAWWEAVPGLRLKDWRPPNNDPWRSQADDGLIGVRRLAYRDHSSFDHWLFDDAQRMTGLWQNAIMQGKPLTLLPLENSLHLSFGDAYNPEGLTPLEAIWRLERIKYGLEVVQGIGFEHAAGYLEVTVNGKPDADDRAIAQKAARAILTAQEGNFAMWTDKVSGKVLNVDFSAAASILEAIRYYGLLKLQLYNMQWVAIASTSGAGAYSAMSDASSMFMIYWNAMLGSFAQQYDDQIGARLWKWNADKFPNATDRPRYTIKPLPKTLSLQELGSFWQVIKNTMPVGDDDYIAIRSQSGILPLELPEVEEMPEPVHPEPTETIEPAEDTAEDTIEDDSSEEMPAEEAQAGELAQLIAELRTANQVFSSFYSPDQERDDRGRFGGGGGESGNSDGGGGGGYGGHEESITDTVAASDVEPFNEVTDVDKYNKLVESMKENGWKGNPVLVYDNGTTTQAITGSHRIYAAREAGIDVPVSKLSFDGAEYEDIQDFLESGDEELTLRIFKDYDFVDRGFITSDQYKIMEEEVKKAQ